MRSLLDILAAPIRRALRRIIVWAMDESVRLTEEQACELRAMWDTAAFGTLIVPEPRPVLGLDAAFATLEKDCAEMAAADQYGCCFCRSRRRDGTAP